MVRVRHEIKRIENAVGKKRQEYPCPKQTKMEISRLALRGINLSTLP
jgi:hypothetical protein